MYKRQEYVWRDESAVRASQVNAGEAQIARFLAPEDCDTTVSYTHLRAHETVLDLVCRLLLEKKKQYTHNSDRTLSYP